MKLCEFCSHVNEPTATYCSHCQRRLPDKPSYADDQRPTDKQQASSLATGRLQPEVRTDHLEEMGPGVFALYLEDTSTPLICHINHQIILGRCTPDSTERSCIDLGPYDAFDKGVSRLHVLIRRVDESGYEILDLGSTNGTYINGNPLTSYEPFRLTNGDQIRLGALNMFFYQSGNSSDHPDRQDG